MAEPEGRFRTMVDRLREKGHRLTPQRLAILKILARSEGHPGVEAIHRQLIQDYPNISLATVYRNVILLKELGEVLELGFADDGNRYDGNNPRPHPHLICIRCRRILDPDLPDLKEASDRLANETGFEILSHRMDFFGICPSCRAKG